MCTDHLSQTRLTHLALDAMPCGVFAVDRDLRVTLWNRFMADRSGVGAESALGQPLFELFPELAVDWLRKKFETVFLLKIGTFTSWEHRPYLLKLMHDRPITGDVECMRQDCSFVPLTENDAVVGVCVTITDVTDLALAEGARRDAVAAFHEASVRDGLTGLYNRRHAETVLSKQFSLWRRTGAPFCILILDLDHFKHINDTYGHPGGDAVLKAVASRALSCLREYDVFARYGGEEFMLILPQSTLAIAAVAGERVRVAIAAGPVVYEDQEIHVTASIGVAQVCYDATSTDDIVQHADGALYSAKARGRNALVTAALRSA